MGFLVAVHQFGCSRADGILVLRPGIEHASLTLESVFLTPGPPGKSLLVDFFFFDDGHSDWCEVILHCSFGVHFSIN